MQFNIMRTQESIGGSLVQIMRVSEDGDYIADFHMSPKGFRAFAAWMHGVSKAGHSVYDNDRKQYIVGSLDQMDPAATIRDGIG